MRRPRIEHRLHLQLIRPPLAFRWILCFWRALDIYSVPQRHRRRRLIKNKNLRPQTRIHVTRTAIFILTLHSARAINSNKQRARRRKREIFARSPNRGNFHTTPCYFYLRSLSGQTFSIHRDEAHTSSRTSSSSLECNFLAQVGNMAVMLWKSAPPVEFFSRYLQRSKSCSKVGDFHETCNYCAWHWKCSLKEALYPVSLNININCLWNEHNRICNHMKVTI